MKTKNKWNKKWHLFSMSEKKRAKARRERWRWHSPQPQACPQLDKSSCLPAGNPPGCHVYSWAGKHYWTPSQKILSRTCKLEIKTCFLRRNWVLPTKRTSLNLAFPVHFFVTKYVSTPKSPALCNHQSGNYRSLQPPYRCRFPMAVKLHSTVRLKRSNLKELTSSRMGKVTE